MSLILDALRRSENGGAAGSPQPPAAEEHSGGLEKKWLGALFAICAGLGIAAGWMMRGDPENPLNAEQVVPLVTRSLSSDDAVTSPKSPGADAAPSIPGNGLSPSTPAATTPGALDAAPAQKNVTADAAEEDKARIAALHQKMWSDAAALSEASVPGSEQAGVSSSASEKREVPAQYEAVSAASSTAPSAKPSIAPPIDLAAAIERAAREVGEPNLVPHPAVLLENLSQQQKDRIPTIVYTQHVYAEGAAPSVELNGQRLRPGQRAGVITVEDILVDSVILRVNGVSFRLRALNTWVNL
jgi:general secretion pathway protein B